MRWLIVPAASALLIVGCGGVSPVLEPGTEQAQPAPPGLVEQPAGAAVRAVPAAPVQLPAGRTDGTGGLPTTGPSQALTSNQTAPTEVAGPCTAGGPFKARRQCPAG